MSKIAFLYPGQGAQKAGMGKDFAESYPEVSRFYDEAGKACDIDMKALCFEENDKLDITAYTQMALVTTELAMTSVLTEAGIKPDVTAGLSLGEYASLAVAGVITPLEAICAVKERGRFMQDEVPAGVGGMAAVIGLSAEEVEKAVAPLENVWVANYNCPGQTVISGTARAVAAAADVLKEAGAKRCLMLNVSGPFHSGLLTGAGEKLRKVLEKLTFKKPEIPYICNVEATYVTEAEPVLELLVRQVSSSVRFEQTLRLMIADGVDTFVEIGPGKTIAGFLKRIDKELTVYSVETVEQAKELIALMKG